VQGFVEYRMIRDGSGRSHEPERPTPQRYNGFNKEGRPAEVFLLAAKDGSTMAAILDDTSTIISGALQHGVPGRRAGKKHLPPTVTALAPPYLRS
jgi:hypothetical protein